MPGTGLWATAELGRRQIAKASAIALDALSEAKEESNTKYRNDSSDSPYSVDARGPANKQAEGDTNQMQKARGDDKTDDVGQWICRLRKLRPVCIAVKDRKCTDDYDCQPQRKLRREEDEQTKHHP